MSLNQSMRVSFSKICGFSPTDYKRLQAVEQGQDSYLKAPLPVSTFSSSNFLPGREQQIYRAAQFADGYVLRSQAVYLDQSQSTVRKTRYHPTRINDTTGLPTRKTRGGVGSFVTKVDIAETEEYTRCFGKLEDKAIA